MQLANGVLKETFSRFLACGRGECECVVYWVGAVASDTVDEVVHPQHTRSPGGYEVDDQWLTNFWSLLARTQRNIKAQVHTHPGEAFHSPTDDMWPVVSQIGFTSIVIPDFAEGPQTMENAWIGRLGEDGKWHEVRGL